MFRKSFLIQKLLPIAENMKKPAKEIIKIVFSQNGLVKARVFCSFNTQTPQPLWFKLKFECSVSLFDFLFTLRELQRMAFLPDLDSLTHDQQRCIGAYLPVPCFCCFRTGRGL